jgi:dienelactone hydrolase
MRKLLAFVLLGFFALLVVPILLARLAEPEWVKLEDTDFQEISFQNTEQNVKLGGMLFVPEGDGPFPAAVIIHGSGTSRRDNGWYLVLSQYLQQNGIVVLLPDKRGSERSAGDWRTASFEDLATDTKAGIRYLKDRDEVSSSDIGIIGLSQGGHIAPIVADQTQDVAFLVNIVGGALPMHDLLVYEETHNLRELGVLPGLSDLLAYPSAWSIRIRQSEFWNAVGNFDPRPYWQRLSVPALVLYGQNDTNVPSRRSAEVLRSLNSQNIEVRIYRDSGHALESPRGEGNSIFREDALKDIRDFIHSASVGG